MEKPPIFSLCESSLDPSIYSASLDTFNHWGIPEGDSLLWQNFEETPMTSMTDVSKEVENNNNNNVDKFECASQDNTNIINELPEVKRDKNRRKGQPRKMPVVSEVQDKVEVTESIQHNQQFNTDPNFVSNQNSQQTLNPSRDPNVQQMLLPPTIQENNTIQPQGYSQMNPHMYPQFYNPMSLPMNPNINLHPFPPMNHNLLPHIPPHANFLAPQQMQSPLMNFLHHPPINPYMNVSNTPNMPTYGLHEPYQQKWPEVHPTSEQPSHLNTTEDVMPSTSQNTNEANPQNTNEVNAPYTNEAYLQNTNEANPQNTNEVNAQYTNEVNAQYTNEAYLQNTNEANLQNTNEVNAQYTNEVNVQYTNEANLQNTNEANPQNTNEVNAQYTNEVNAQYTNEANLQNTNEANLQNTNEANPQEMKQENAQETKQENAQEMRQENAQEMKQENAQEMKQENAQETKQENVEEMKQENSQDTKQEHAQETKQENAQETKKRRLSEVDESTLKETEQPNLQETKKRRLSNTDESNPREMGHQNLGETKKQKLSKVNESSAQKKTKRAKKTRQQQFPQHPMQNYQYLQPPVHLLENSTPIQNRYVDLRRDMGGLIMQEAHKRLREQYYHQYLLTYQNLMYKSRPDLVQSNLLPNPLIAQEWYQKLLIMYTKLMKTRTKTAQNPPVNRNENLSRNSTNSNQTAETITVTPDLHQDGENDMQWLNETPTIEEVAYWNDSVLRQGMHELASRDPVSAQRHLKAKYEELQEIILAGMTSSGKNAS